MRSYFGQFGDVLRVKVSLNKKTGPEALRVRGVQTRGSGGDCGGEHG